MAASLLYNTAVKYDLIPLSSPTLPSFSTLSLATNNPSSPTSTSPTSTSHSINNLNNLNSSTNSSPSLRKSILHQRIQIPSSSILISNPPRTHHHSSSIFHSNTNLQFLHLRPHHKKTNSIQLAGRFEKAMSSSVMLSPLKEQPTRKVSPLIKDYVYTAPCEHHPSKGRTEYLINDMFPKLSHDLSTIEFGIRIADFMPLAFKTVPVAGLAEQELLLLQGLGKLPNVIQLQDSFINDHGDTVLVLPMLKKFECRAFNSSLLTVQKSMKQILTGLAAVHAKNIVHLDINPSNLMVTHQTKEIVIIDFGLSQTVDRKPTSSERQVPACGTIGYIAPEVLQTEHYPACDPTLSDLYSVGIVLGQMLESYIPDCDLHYFGSKFLSSCNTTQTAAYLHDFIALGSCYPKMLLHAADLLMILLQERPQDRKSASELLESHPFFSDCCGANVELADWAFRVNEIKYQKYLCNEKNSSEIYRYR